GMVLRRLFLTEISQFDLVTDSRALIVALGAALFAALLPVIQPVVFTSRGDVVSTLKAGQREGTYHRSRARSALLIIQGAFSMALLVGAGLFVRSLSHVREMRLGFDADRILIVRRNLRGASMSDSDLVRLSRR